MLLNPLALAGLHHRCLRTRLKNHCQNTLVVIEHFRHRHLESTIFNDAEAGISVIEPSDFIDHPPPDLHSQIGDAWAGRIEASRVTAANFIMNQNEHTRFVIRQS
jgi:hypothetical protein